MRSLAAPSSFPCGTSFYCILTFQLRKVHIIRQRFFLGVIAGEVHTSGKQVWLSAPASASVGSYRPVIPLAT